MSNSTPNFKRPLLHAALPYGEALATIINAYWRLPVAHSHKSSHRESDGEATSNMRYGVPNFAALPTLSTYTHHAIINVSRDPYNRRKWRVVK